MKWRITFAVIYLFCAIMDIPMGIIRKDLWEIACGMLFLTLSLSQFNQWRNERGALHRSDGLPWPTISVEEEARRLKREAAHDDDTRIIAMLCEELDRQQSDLSRRSGSANPATARDTRGESLRKEQNGEIEWVDDERRGPMLKPAVPKRSHTSPPSDA